MTHCTGRTIRLANRRRRRLAAGFRGAGMLVSEPDRQFDPTAGIDRLIGDSRQPASCRFESQAGRSRVSKKSGSNRFSRGEKGFRKVLQGLR